MNATPALAAAIGLLWWLFPVLAPASEADEDRAAVARAYLAKVCTSSMLGSQATL